MYAIAHHKTPWNNNNKFLFIGKEPTDYIIKKVVDSLIKSSISFINPKAFLKSIKQYSNESYLHVNKTQIPKIECLHILNAQQICLEIVSKDFTRKKLQKKEILEEIALNYGTVFDFSFDYSLFEIKDIVNNHEYLKKIIVQQNFKIFKSVFLLQKVKCVSLNS